MRKILTASAVAIALVAGQAAAAGAAQQTIKVGDRIGAPMGDEDNQVPVLGGLFTSVGGGLAGAAVVALAVIIPVAIVAEVASDDDSASG